MKNFLWAATVAAATLLFIPLAFAQNTNCQTPPLGLFSWWPGEGNANDFTGNHPGTLQNGAGFASTGKVAQAFSLDGVNDYADLGNWFNLQVFTVAMWVKPGVTQLVSADLVDNNHTDSRSWAVEYNNTSDATNSYFTFTAAGVGSVTFGLKQGVWQFLAISLDTDRMARVYLDGALAGSIQGTGPIAYDGTQFLRLGRWGGGAKYFTGQVDEVTVFSRALAFDEIAALYSADSAGMCAPTVLVPFQGQNWRWRQVNSGTLVGFQTGLEPAGFADGQGGFGSGGGCALQSARHTPWSVLTDMLLRRTINLPRGATGISVGAEIDNTVQVWWNGVDISGGARAGSGCALSNQFMFPVRDGIVLRGDNLLAVRGHDLGSECYLDVRVLAINTNPPPAPDLLGLNVTGAASAGAGLPILVSWLATNQGDVVAEAPWTETLLLATNSAGSNAQFIASFIASDSLAAGASAARAATIILPAGLSGTYYLVIQSDSGNQIPEGVGEANNLTVAAQSIIVSAPDLRLHRVTAPASAQFGQSVSVTCVVTNPGSAVAAGSWSDRLVFSADTALGNDTLLLTRPAAGVAPLVPGASYSWTQSVVLPLTTSSTAGTYYILATTDSANSVHEANKTNNTTASAAITLSLSPRPDLAVTNLALLAAAQPGGLATLSWVVTNRGTVAAVGPWTESISLSSDAVIGNDWPVAVFTFTNTLAPGAWLVRTQSVVEPVAGPAGDLRFVVATDSSGDIVEVSETNNAAIGASVLQVAQTLTLQLATNRIAENAALSNIVATVTRNGSRASALAVSLASGDTNHLTVPAGATILAGQSAAAFNVTVRRDDLVTGALDVDLVAAAAGFVSGTNTVTVLDSDQPRLALVVSNSLILEGTTTEATVTRELVTDQPLVVTLGSSSPGRLTAPSTVTIPANQASASFTVLAVDDSLIEATRAFTLTASAPDWSAASATVAIVDDDLPALSLALARPTVSENAGSVATTATVTRNRAGALPLVVALESSEPASIFVPAGVTIQAGQFSATFNISAIDNNLLDGTRVVNLRAFVTETLTGTRLPGPAMANLTVFDDDGPALRLVIARDVVPEGASPATTATVTRNNGTNGALLVSLASSDTNDLIVPPTVTIPAGQVSATFDLASVNDGVADGSKTVTVTASAGGFSSGVDIVVVSDINLPDLLITSVSAPSSGLTETYFNVSFREANQGLAPADGTWAQRIFISSDPYPDHGQLLGEIGFSGTLPVGQSYERSLPFRLPRTAGDYWIIVTSDATNSVTEVLENNNTTVTAAPIHVAAAYSATVQTDLEVAPAGTTVPMRGHAVQAGSGQPAAFVLVNAHILLRDTRRIISAVTDQNGDFAANFTPLPGEAGFYQIGAAHPGLATAPVQDSFTLLGLKFNAPQIAHRFNAQSFVTGVVQVVNLSDAPITGLRAVFAGLPDGLAGQADVAGVLAGGGTNDLVYQITSTSDAGVSGTFTLHLDSTEGAQADLPVLLAVRALRPQLVASPAALQAGMVRGGQTIVSFQLINAGGVETGPLNVLLPDVPWLRLASGGTLPSLPPGSNTTVTLLLTPAADLPLTEYSGALAANAAQASVAVPFVFRALSEGLGALRVEAVDEYTYYADGAPRVQGASIVVKDALSGATITNGVADTNGLAVFSGLPEGYYRIEASAPDHSSFRGNVLVRTGLTNNLTAFLVRQTVRFYWTVTPTEIEDRTRITLLTEFETFVPIPVVTATPSLIDLSLFTNDVSQMDLTIENHGLIAAQHVRYRVSADTRWSIEPLITDLGTLPANSSLTIPVTIRKLHGAGARSAAAQSHTPKAATDPCGPIPTDIQWDLPCGGSTVSHSTPVPAVNPGGGAGCIGPPPPPGGRGGAGPTLMTRGPYDCELCEPFEPPDIPFVPRAGGDPLPIVITPLDCGSCVNNLAKAVYDCAWGFSDLRDLSKCAYGIFGCGAGLYQNGLNVGTILSCTSTAFDCAAAAGKKSPLGEAATALSCAYDITHACGSYGVGPSPASSSGAWHQPKAQAKSAPVPGLDLVVEHTRRLQTWQDFLVYLIGDPAWLHPNQSVALGEWLSAFTNTIRVASDDGGRVSTTERAALLAVPFPDRVNAAQINAFLDRWNRSLDYWQAGIFALADVPAGQNTNFIATDVYTNICGAALDSLNRETAEGFGDPLQGLNFAVLNLRTNLSVILNTPSLVSSPPLKAARAAKAAGGGGVCAHVKLRIDQQAVLTRDAFDAGLEIVNGSGSALENVRVDLFVQDASGALATGLFALQPPTLSGLSDVTGTGRVEPNATGAAHWLLIPTPDAATNEPVQYAVGGAISYMQDGVEVSEPLLPASITVHPSPSLTVKYFHERDVLGDDPFTAAVEPSVPFSLAVLVLNTGQGVAKNLRITSAQPEIVENEKGLLIDFNIIATEVAGQNLTPSLTANFGNINPGQIAIARWLFQSTLQGNFDSYNATFQHLDAFGDPRLSLIDSVEIHELIRIVRAAGSFKDGKPDFLVNDVPDDRNLPDTLYLSDGSVAPVSTITTAQTNGLVTVGNLTVQLTATMPAGWTYLRVPDPGRGQFRLKRAVRSDGAEISFGTNVWMTDRTFIGHSRRPVYENNLHLLDHDSTGSYTLTYEVPPPADTTPPSSAVAALPAHSAPQIPVHWSGSDDAGDSGLAFFDVFVSVNNGPFTPWLEQTTLNGAVYPGAFGSSYAFYSAATDQTGNTEPPHTTPDAQTVTDATNTPPALTVSPPRVVNEGTTVLLTNTATDADVPANTLTFDLLPGAPSGATINPFTGLITWPTGESTGPSTNAFTVRVTDNGVPTLSATGTVTVIVNEVNTRPVLSPIASRTINEGVLLLITNRATDSDRPPNTLTFSLGPGKPDGASIDLASGVFSWRPSEFQGPSTNAISVIVTDNGLSSLSATQQFTVIVRDVSPDFLLSLGSTNVVAGETNSVPILLTSGAELTNLSFLFETPPTRLTNLALLSVVPQIAAFSIQPAGSNRSFLNFGAGAGQVLQGALTVAQLGFTAVSNEHSAVVPLRVSDLLGLRAGGPAMTNGLAGSSRVVVVCREPVLVPERAPSFSFTLYGWPGTNYALQSSTNLGMPTNWMPSLNWTLSNAWQRFVWTNLSEPGRFFRAVQE